MTSRLIRLGDALSQFFNVLIFNGDSNYSISGDAYLASSGAALGLSDADLDALFAAAALIEF